MSALDRREGIIEAAKDDARAAVDLLLDAIGRILLAHLDAHETTTSPAPVKPSKSRKGVINPRPAVARSATQQMLAALIAKDEQDMLLDAEGLTRTEQEALRTLRRAKLAVTAAPGLWRPTLAGIAAARETA